MKLVLIAATTILVLTGSHFAQTCPPYTSGCLDEAFAGTGLLMPVAPAGLNYQGSFRDSVVQSDGKIVWLINARTTVGSTRNAMQRINPDGSPDPSFGTRGDGWVLMPWDSLVYTGAPVQYAASMAIQNVDGEERFVFVGPSVCGNLLCTRIERYTNSGEPDLSFGTNGVAILTGSRVGHTTRVAIRPSDQKIVISGRLDALARLNADGSPDTSFGPGGVSAVNTGIDIFDITVLPNGRIIAGGRTTKQNSDFVVQRFNPDGSIDDGSRKDTTPGDSFGSAGRRTVDFAGGADEGDKLAVDHVDGRIILVGRANISGTIPDAAVACVTSSGAICPSFGTGGKATLNPGDGFDQLAAVAIQSDRKIVVFGEGRAPGASVSNADFLIARFNTNGTLDTGFADGGWFLKDFFGQNDKAWGMIYRDPNCAGCPEKIFVNGNVGTYSWALMRLIE